MSETNAIDHMNTLLATKPGVSKSGTRKVAHTICKTIGLARDRYDVCSTTYTNESYDYVEPAKATASRVLEVRNLAVKTALTTTLPDTALLTRKLIRNNADVTTTSNISLSVSGTQSWSVSKTQGVSTTTGGSCTLAVGIPNLGTGTISINWSQNVSTSTAVSESETRVIARSTSDTILVGPRRCVNIELLAYQSSAAVPFEAEIVVDGDLEPNNNGITQASQILTVAERTFSFTGIIQISDVSDAFLTTTDIGLVGTGQDADTALESMEYGAVVVPSLTSNYATRFARLASMARTAEASAIETRKARELEENEPVIGVPDGIRYEVLYVTSTYKATPLCGFNDLGIMNTGIFMVECRQYTNYVNGVPAAQWQELVETFSSCFLT